MVGVDPEDAALPLAVGDDPVRNKAEDKTAVKRSFMGSCGER
jgi:hypothetical protein